MRKSIISGIFINIKELKTTIKKSVFLLMYNNKIMYFVKFPLTFIVYFILIDS